VLIRLAGHCVCFRRGGNMEVVLEAAEIQSSASIARDADRIFSLLIVDVTQWLKEACCGDPVSETGSLKPQF
jgi:hypothetical protein